MGGVTSGILRYPSQAGGFDFLLVALFTKGWTIFFRRLGNFLRHILPHLQVVHDVFWRANACAIIFLKSNTGPG